MRLALFFVPAILFFWAFAYFFHHPEVVTENRALVSGPAFAVGIAPLFLFFNHEASVRLKAMLIWFVGMLSGIGAAAYLFFDRLPPVPA